MKKVLIGLAVVVAIVGITIWLFLGSLDDIVAGQIKSIGSELTGVPVAVDSVRIKLGDGSGQIKGLRISNPPGYKSNTAFNMDLLRLGINLDSLGTPPLTLNELIIDSPIVNLEVNNKGGSNLKDIATNVSNNTAKADKKSEEASDGKPIKIAIRKLTVKGVALHIQGVESMKGTSITLPSIELTEVGGKQGATPGQIGTKVMVAVISEVLKLSAAQAIEGSVEEKVDEIKGGVLDALKDKFK